LRKDTKLDEIKKKYQIVTLLDIKL
jgi:hypothetical protein